MTWCSYTATNEECLWQDCAVSAQPWLQYCTLSPGPWFNIKMSSYQYRKSHCGDKTVVRSSYLQIGISYIGKMVSFYWIGPLEAQYILSFTTYKILFCMKWILDIHKSNNHYLYSSARYKVLRMASMWQMYYWNEQNDGIKDYNRESPYVDQNLCRL